MVDDVSPPPLERIIESMLFLGGPPLPARRAVDAVRGLTTEQFQEMIARLNQAYRAQNRPYRILPRGDGHELVLRPDFRFLREKLHGTVREARLSQAAQDTLALVAYRQPIGRQEVEALRGADSLALLRQLVRLGLISVQRGQGEQPEPVYSTTRRFLELMGLTSLEDLPRTDET